MRNITEEELKAILENHKHWVYGDVEGWRRMKADLHDADLRNADLCAANLSCANLKGADLSHANMYATNLRNADLCAANLSYANLYNADLSHADLRNADLRGANWHDADLYAAKLPDTNIISYIPMACPDTGMFIGWKKCKNNVIVKLFIPEDAKRSSATGRKCRCNKAVVLDIEGADVAYSMHDNNFVYRKGETVTVEDFDNDRFTECAPGIHFFINREEAIYYG